MAWFECHEQIRDEIKIRRLAGMLGTPYTQAVGICVCMWAWATGHKRNGDLSELSEEEIRYVCCAEIAGETLKNALTECGLLDEKGRINAWKKHGVKLLEADRYRKKMKRVASQDSPRTVPGTSELPTQPTQPTQPTKDQKIKDMAVENLLKSGKPVENKKSLALRAFMSHLNQALKTKTGLKRWAIANKIYGIAVAYIAEDPVRQAELSAAIDRMPGQMQPVWYIAAVRSWITEQRWEVAKKQPPVEALKSLTAGIGRKFI